MFVLKMKPFGNAGANAGSVCHDKAIDNATNEYKKYQQKTLSEVEMSFLDSLKKH